MKTSNVAVLQQGMQRRRAAGIGAHNLQLWIGAFILLLGLASIPAMAEAPSKKQGYEVFKMMRTRNIFDPNRQPNTPSAPRPVRATAPAAPEYAALTGIMISADKAMAFFSGSRPEFNKVLAVNAEIAGARIVAINAATIEIECEGKRVTVSVGQTVPTDGSAPTAAPAPAAGIPASESSQSTTTAPAAGSSKKEALLRRMMERRQQETK